MCCVGALNWLFGRSFCVETRSQRKEMRLKTRWSAVGKSIISIKVFGGLLQLLLERFTFGRVIWNNFTTAITGNRTVFTSWSLFPQIWSGLSECMFCVQVVLRGKTWRVVGLRRSLCGENVPETLLGLYKPEPIICRVLSHAGCTVATGCHILLIQWWRWIPPPRVCSVAFQPLGRL